MQRKINSCVKVIMIIGFFILPICYFINVDFLWCLYNVYANGGFIFLTALSLILSTINIKNIKENYRLRDKVILVIKDNKLILILFLLQSWWTLKLI